MVSKDSGVRVLVATDLSAASEPALIRARDHARAVGALLVVCHIVPNGLHNNALFPHQTETEAIEVSNLLKRAGDLVDDQISRFEISPDETKIIIESGSPDEEIVRIAEDEGVELIVIGGRQREGVERVVGHIAERIARYAPVPVLIAREGPRSGRVLVATDLSEASRVAQEMAAMLVKTVGIEATLLHVGGSPADAPSLQSLCEKYGLLKHEQLDGDPDVKIVERASAMGAELIIVGSRGRTRLRRMALGSVAEAVVRSATCSVLVARPRD